MSGIRTSPFASKYIIHKEEAGKQKYWSTHTTYDDLLFANGQHVKDYADLYEMGKQDMYGSDFGRTLSKEMASLTDFISGIGGEIDIEENYVRWKIFGQPDMRAQSAGNSNPEGVECPGAGGVPAKLLLDVDWYQAHDVLAPLKNKRCQVVIISDSCVPVNGAYEYEVRLLDDDETAFLDEELLATGEYWIKMGALTGPENYGTSGSIQFGENFAYLEFEIPLTTMSWEFSVEGQAHRKWGNLEIARCEMEMDGKPKMTKRKDGSMSPTPIKGTEKITNYLEMAARRQKKLEKDLFLLYGSMSSSLTDKNSGETITTGPGIMEFLEQGNTIPYSPFAQGIGFIVEQMEAFWFDKVSTGNRDILLYTGEAGLKLFSKWVRQEFGDTAVMLDHNFYLNATTPFDGREGRKGFSFRRPQFTKYVLDGFGSITVAHLPFLDNTRINGVKFPGTHYPVSSYEFIAFDIGYGEPNVKLLTRKDNKLDLYITGLWSPFGAVGADNPVYKSPGDMALGESYKHLERRSCGVLMENPERSLYFRPNVR